MKVLTVGDLFDLYVELLGDLAAGVDVLAKVAAVRQQLVALGAW